MNNGERRMESGEWRICSEQLTIPDTEYLKPET